MVTYTSQTEVAKGSYASPSIKQKIGRFDISMDDSSSMDVTKRSKQTTEVGFDARHRQRAIYFAEVLVPVIRHYCDNLILVSERSNELRNVSTSATVFHDRYLIAHTFRIAGYIYPLDGDHDFRPHGLRH